MSDIRIKLLEANLSAQKARLASATDKDSLRRQIKATEQLLRSERERG